ncbi:MAG: efflux RND transporter periplasmic adaptor subunit [Elusimicrobia bacterium]|nr:efflux RND transporter periplasmic adaptor subunit [Elusimicrobiota bacterium]
MKRAMILICAALAAASCSGKERAAAPLAVTVEPVVSALKAGELSYTANIIPAERVDLAFRIGGYVDSVLMRGGRKIQEGDSVSKGTVLVTLRGRDYMDKLTQARGALGEAQAYFDCADKDYLRASRLYGKNSLTKPEMDGATAKFKAAKSKLEAARALVSDAELALSDSRLKAPISGSILARLIEPGDLAGPGSPAFVIGDISSVKAVFGVPDGVVKKLKIGQEAEVKLDAVPGRVFKAGIARINPAADSRGRVFDVEVRIPNAGLEIKPGMAVSVVLGGDGEKSLYIPVSAVTKPDRGQQWLAVYVAEKTPEGYIARLRRVETGGFSGNRVEVLSGLKEGEKVIIKGANLAVDGQAVSVAE